MESILNRSKRQALSMTKICSYEFIFFSTAAIIFLTGCATAPLKAPESFYRFDQFERSMQMPDQSQPILQDVGREPRKTAQTLRTRSVAPNRRPQQDPFRIGESLALNMKIAGIPAGTLELQTSPLAFVNGRKVYLFSAHLVSNKIFSLFFRVDDTLIFYYDYDLLVPISGSTHIEEGRKRQETRTYYDLEHLHAVEWERTIEKNDPIHERTKAWNFQTLSQSLFSTLYYLRTQRLEPGHSVEFPATHDEKNFIFKVDVLRRESIKTAAGDIPTIVVRPSQSFAKIFNKSNGDTLLWLSDDQRKVLVRMETPLKLGQLIGQLESVEPDLSQ